MGRLYWSAALRGRRLVRHRMGNGDIANALGIRELCKMTESSSLSWEAKEVFQKIKTFNRLPGAGIPLIQLNMRVGSAKTVKKGIPELKSVGLIAETASGDPTLTEKAPRPQSDLRRSARDTDWIIFGEYRDYTRLPRNNGLYMDRFGCDDTDYSVVVKNKGLPSEPVEVGDLSSRQIERDRAVAGLFSHCGGG